MVQMIKVSDEFKEALNNDERNFDGSCTITLSDGTAVPVSDSDIWDGGFKFDDATSNNSTFDIGSAIVQKFTLILNNCYGDFTEYDFTGAEISDVNVSLELPSGKTETISKGVFTVSETSYDGDLITLECLDNMHKFDVGYSKSNLVYPATLLQIVQDACSCCNVVLATDSLQFEYHSYVISTRAVDESITFRDVLTWVGQISGHFWKCNAKGQLSAGWYDMGGLEKGENVHTFGLNTVTDLTADMDDVVITGVKVITENADLNQITVQSGSDGYVLAIDSNKFITADNASEIASMIGGRVVGLRFRPLSASLLPDPTVEAGDGAVVYDSETLSYKTFITNVEFSLDDDMQVSNDAESALRHSSERFSEAAKVYQSLKSHIQKNKSEWEKAYDELKKAMEGKNGLYPVMQTQSDGSTIINFCDTPTLEEATVVVRLSAGGWGMSTDGGKTWNVGALVNGTTITKILNAIGINANWINTGALTVIDEDGNTIFQVDVDKKTARFSGDIRIGSSNNKFGAIKVYDENGNMRTAIDRYGIWHIGDDRKAPYHYRTESCTVTINKADFLGGGTNVCYARAEFLMKGNLSDEFIDYWSQWGAVGVQATASIREIGSPGTPSSSGIYSLGTLGLGSISFGYDDAHDLIFKLRVECSYIMYGFNNISPRYVAPNHIKLDIHLVY